MANATSDLRVRDLVVTTDSGRAILDVPALDVPPGTALGVEGPSGAGKSTLIFALAGLLTAKSGEVLWGATDMLALREERRARFRADHIGLIFQDFLLFEELDPLGNAAVQALFAKRPRRAGLKATAQALLSNLGVPSEARNVASFSGGERQRVAMARALAHDPSIILADEPTANLHRDAADALTDDLLARARDRGCTLIVVSHDRHLLDRMDRNVAIVDGQLALGAYV